jgi:hypothetical protein
LLLNFLKVIYIADVGDFVTSVRFCADGTMVFAGTYTVLIFISDNLYFFCLVFIRENVMF